MFAVTWLGYNYLLLYMEMLESACFTFGSIFLILPLKRRKLLIRWHRNQTPACCMASERHYHYATASRAVS